MSNEHFFLPATTSSSTARSIRVNVSSLWTEILVWEICSRLWAALPFISIRACYQVTADQQSSFIVPPAGAQGYFRRHHWSSCVPTYIDSYNVTVIEQYVTRMSSDFILVSPGLNANGTIVYRLWNRRPWTRRIIENSRGLPWPVSNVLRNVLSLDWSVVSFSTRVGKLLSQ